MIHTFEHLCTAVYVLVDDLYQRHVRPFDQRPGPRAVFTDSEVLTVALVAEFVSLDEEIAILG